MTFWTCFTNKRADLKVNFIFGFILRNCTDGSSVARGWEGGLEPPIGLGSMQNRTFLLLFRPVFGEKLKTVPPKGNWVTKL